MEKKTNKAEMKAFDAAYDAALAMNAEFDKAIADAIADAEFDLAYSEALAMDAEFEAAKARADKLLRNFSAHGGFQPRGICKAFRACAHNWNGSRKEFIEAARDSGLNPGNAAAEWQQAIGKPKRA